MENIKNSFLANLIVACVLIANGSAAQALVANSLGPVFTLVSSNGIIEETRDQLGEFSGSYVGTGGPGTQEGLASVSASISLGAMPQVTADVFVSSPLGSSFGPFSVSALLIYRFAYVTQQNIQSLRTKADVFGSASMDVVRMDDTSAASAGVLSYLTIAGPDFTYYGGLCGSIFVAYQIDQRSTGCGDPTVPIEDFFFDLVPNMVYTVTMDANVSGYAQSAATAAAHVVLDPVFTILGGAPSDGQFIFSEGVTSPTASVSEPGTLALLGIAGLALSGLRRRYGRSLPCGQT